MWFVRALGVVASSLIAVPAFAAGGDAARAAIQKIAPLQEISEFRESALPGYYEASPEVAEAEEAEGQWRAARQMAVRF